MRFKITQNLVSEPERKVVASQGRASGSIYIPLENNKVLKINQEKGSIWFTDYPHDYFNLNLFKPIYEGELNISIEG